jgi:uncharacterized protein
VSAAAPDLPFAVARDGMRLAIRLVPKSATSRILGLVDGALKVAVHAAPEDGKANDALLRLLAQSLRLPRRDLTLAMGATQRKKLVHIAGDPARLAPLLAEALEPWLKRA